MEKALFGAGCFWGVEDFFRQVPGVIEAVSGYAGGTTQNPTYKQVCNDETYHAEVVEVTLRPRQGQLRQPGRAVLPHAQPHPEEPPGAGLRHPVPLGDLHPWRRAGARRRAEIKAKVEASGKWNKPVVTQIEPAPAFWKAEEHHQRYFEKHGGHCHVSFAELAGRGRPLTPDVIPARTARHATARRERQLVFTAWSSRSKTSNRRRRIGVVGRHRHCWQLASATAMPISGGARDNEYAGAAFRTARYARRRAFRARVGSFDIGELH